ncbi:TIGR03084 family metal-binding protein [Shimia marina]|uniref:Putative Actinobacterial protein n=1 Tax=Shimia marina TaxID=321267 RepID=A0A0P1F9Z0_9RHOB|nr:TIGR03084 family metal-binding protein [Shimia marina]CUH51233.1 putative Actinobacterial protein [Shimia marina]SFD54419.1 TIGR03084 family protein [Shimia marina]
MLSQADDFLTETEVLHDAIAEISDADLQQITQFKGWTIEDVLIHLHFWNTAADLSASDETAFMTRMRGAMASLQQTGSLRSFENGTVQERGAELRDIWLRSAQDMATRWRDMDPKARLPWVGPSMSARSSMTARQMETWAHGFEIFDLLGQSRADTDRIQNIVVLGVNTFGWSHQVHNLPVPKTLPRITLTSPSGAIWTFGEEGSDSVTGSAADFAAVVTQTRAFSDTDLIASGPISTTWMTHAQCFAGPPETPPEPGSRYKKT